MSQFVHTVVRLGNMEMAILTKQDEAIDEAKIVQAEQKRLRAERNKRHREKKKIEDDMNKARRTNEMELVVNTLKNNKR